jgi:hypothetical protein
MKNQGRDTGPDFKIVSVLKYFVIEKHDPGKGEY